MAVIDVGARRGLMLVAATVLLVFVAPMGDASAQSFANCDEARAAGASNLRAGMPGYSSALDADGDGIACEDDALAGPPPEVLAATDSAEVAQAPTDELAHTGSWTWVLVAIAGILLVAGRRLMSSGYEHLAWVQGRPRSEVRYTIERSRRRRR